MAVVLDPPEVKPEAPKAVEILPATHPTSGMPKNYRVEVALFGGFRRGSIIPKHVVVRSAGAGAAGKEDEICNAKVMKRQLSETYDDVNVDLAPQPSQTITSELSFNGTIADVKDLEVKVTGLRGEIAATAKDRDAWKGLVESKDSMLAEQQELIGELRGTLVARENVIAKQQGEIRVLTDTLDAATKPKGSK